MLLRGAAKDRPEGGNHISFHKKRVENTEVVTARLNGGALSGRCPVHGRGAGAG